MSPGKEYCDWFRADQPYNISRDQEERIKDFCSGTLSRYMLDRPIHDRYLKAVEEIICLAGEIINE